MLTKQLARGLLPLVNTQTNNDVLCEYATYRIGVIQKELETSVDINTILRLQGQIKELRRLLDLKAEAVQDAK